MNETIYKKKLLRHAQPDWYNYLCKALPQIAIIGSFISLMTRNISHNCGNFLQNRTTFAPPPPRSNLYPPPHYLWLVKCLILRVRNLKCIFLKSLLLYRLNSRQHFYFARFLSRIPETWADQRPIVSR